jgi:TRAP transporter 4TM/12TM fusion protein
MKLDWSHAGVVRGVAGAIAVAMSLFHLWVIVFGAPEALFLRGTHLIFAMALVFLWYRLSGRSEGAPSLLDYLLLAAAIAPIVYLLVNYAYITNRIYYIDDLSTADMVLGSLLVAIVLEATRRMIGWPLPLTAVIFLGYALLIARIPPMQLLDQLFMTTEGIFGIPLSVSASYVVIFVLFGSFMERTGTGQLFMDFAMALTGHTAGGPGKVSVVSSSLFGTISGSAVANVMVDGPIAIPLMKRTGFKPHFAAGVESVASTGGQIMPPIMGAAAFVMAEFLQVGYGQVIIWALVPAILYYVSCFCAVHFEAKRNGIFGVPRSELPHFRTVIGERGHLFIPILTILAVMYSGYSAPMAAFWGTILCFPVAALKASTRANVTLTNLVEALIDGARNALAVALACACAGIIIGIVTQTGVGLVFTQAVVGLAQDTLLLALLLTAAAGIVLGMGMPTTPAYIIMTSLLVPAVVKLGVAVPAAHLFAFYFAILSAITPPVALAVFAAAGLAKADLWSSGWAAMKIGAAGFIVPFMFVYEPALMMLDPTLAKSKDLITASYGAIAWATGTAIIGIAFLAGGLHGYFAARATLLERAALIIAAFFLVNPNALASFMPDQSRNLLQVLTDGIGFGLGGIVLLVHLARRRRSPAEPSARAG